MEQEKQMSVELVVALITAIPIALIITRITMAVTERHNRVAERWEYYCRIRK
jgi:hypothetical protein